MNTRTFTDGQVHNLMLLLVAITRQLPDDYAASLVANEVQLLGRHAAAHKVNVEREQITLGSQMEEHRNQRRRMVGEATEIVNYWNEMLRQAGTLSMGVMEWGDDSKSWAQGWDIEQGAMTFNVCYTNEKGERRTYYLTATN